MFFTLQCSRLTNVFVAFVELSTKLQICVRVKVVFFSKVDSSKESAEAACDILSQLVNCSLKTLGLISTARPSFMDLPKVSADFVLLAVNRGVW